MNLAWNCLHERFWFVMKSFILCRLCHEDGEGRHYDFNQKDAGLFGDVGQKSICGMREDAGSLYQSHKLCNILRQNNWLQQSEIKRIRAPCVGGQETIFFDVRRQVDYLSVLLHYPSLQRIIIRRSVLAVGTHRHNLDLSFVLMVCDGWDENCS